MNRDWRPETEWRTPSGRHRRSAAATAPSYDYGYPIREREVPPARRSRRRSRSRTGSAANRRFAVFLVALLVWAGLGYATGVVRILALQREIGQVQRDLATTRRQNKELEKAVAEMQTPEYIERAARDQLGLIRPDEVRFVVGRPVDPTNPNRRDVVRRPGAKDVYD